MTLSNYINATDQMCFNILMYGRFCRIRVWTINLKHMITCVK